MAARKTRGGAIQGLCEANGILSSGDPARRYQQLSTLDLLLASRLELLVGHVAYIASFPLFEHLLANTELLFRGKLERLTATDEHQPVTWPGLHRPVLAR
jgi:hypothetical protein